MYLSGVKDTNVNFEALGRKTGDVRRRAGSGERMQAQKIINDLGVAIYSIHIFKERERMRFTSAISLAERQFSCKYRANSGDRVSEQSLMLRDKFTVNGEQ
jgi:hypothetical protein